MSLSPPPQDGGRSHGSLPHLPGSSDLGRARALPRPTPRPGQNCRGKDDCRGLDVPCFVYQGLMIGGFNVYLFQLLKPIEKNYLENTQEKTDFLMKPDKGLRLFFVVDGLVLPLCGQNRKAENKKVYTRKIYSLANTSS